MKWGRLKKESSEGENDFLSTSRTQIVLLVPVNHI